MVGEVGRGAKAVSIVLMSRCASETLHPVVNNLCKMHNNKVGSVEHSLLGGYICRGILSTKYFKQRFTCQTPLSLKFLNPINHELSLQFKLSC